MKMIEHNHFICHLILGTFTEYPCLLMAKSRRFLLRQFYFKTAFLWLRVCIPHGDQSL